MENYHVLELIGEGSFGRVYKGRKKFSGQVVALKFIPKFGRSEKELKSLRREIEIMRNMHHTNIIEMIDSFETEKEVVAVTDYAEGELFQILEDDGSLPEEQVQAIACQLVSALYYLHAHRILHRDMKPQNILLGKGAVIKLCDFGFARAMSINTLVLTSIKGTPLYMSPELVEEKPYDHTADLWALGCILYELFTGQPPFYTNSIFQLVSLIIKDPVRWPKTMSPPFKDFLQGLLTKNSRHRLAWPLLLEHPFVASGVTVSEEDKQLMSPFTCAPTASLIFEKEKQVKAKAHPPGASKILTKAREKVEQEQKKKKARTEAWSKEHHHALHPGAAPQQQQPATQEAAAENCGGSAPPPVPPPEVTVEPIQATQQSQTDQDWAKTGISEMVEPTPRPDRISKDYSREYPSVEVGSCKILNRQPEKTKKNFENVKLNEEDADSDDEWQGLVDQTDPDSNEPDAIVALMKDAAFTSKLHTRLHSASAQVLEAILEGASQLRPVLRIIINLVTVKCDLDCLQSFLKSVDCPGHILSLLHKVLESSSVKEQTWCEQILIDLVATLHAYLSGSFLMTSDELDTTSLQLYRETCEAFILLLPKLLSQKLDRDLRLREQSVLCVIYVCEVLEKMRGPLPDQLFEFISGQQPVLEAILLGAMLDESLLKRLEDVAEGESDLAQQRMEDLICLNAAAIAALTHRPVGFISCVSGKRQVANAVATLLCEKHMAGFTQDYLLLLNHPSTCSNALKVLYACCQVNKGLCVYLAGHQRELLTLLAILQGKVELEDMECNAVFEMVLYLLSVIIVQLGEIPPDIMDGAPFLVSIFIESQLASHTAAAALLFGQLMRCGAAVEVVPEDILTATLSEFTDLAQICVRCPFDYGVLDGIILLLSQLLAQAELPMASLYLDHGVWSILWHRVAQMLQVQNPDTDMPLHDIETDGFEVAMTSARSVAPDWSLLSFSGLCAMLHMAVVVFTKETFQVVSCLADTNNIISLTLMHLLSPEFLQSLSNSAPEGGGEVGVAVDVVHPVVQLCCFPFAIDINSDLLAGIQTCFAGSHLLPRLLHASVTYLKPLDLDLPIGLLSRLVLGDSVFVEQFARCVDDLKAVPFFTACLKQEPHGSPSLICDTLSICSHLVRTSPSHLDIITQMFRGPKRDYELLVSMLGHSAAVVRSRTCSMLGNMLKHSGTFYAVLGKCDKLMSGLVTCLSDEDPDVRKGASYAIGNAAYHSGALYSKLQKAIPSLISLLDDPVAKTRANAVGVLGNLALHSDQLCSSLLTARAIHSMLEMACHDTQYGVQECALMALRSMCSQPTLKKELLKLKAVDKLSRVSDSRARSSRPTSPASSSTSSSSRQLRPSLSLSKSLGRHSVTNVMQHCNRLIKVLRV